MINLYLVLYTLIAILAIYFISKSISHFKSKKPFLTIKDLGIKEKINDLTFILGKPTYVEMDGDLNLISTTWMSPLDKFTAFGKFGGCDYIKILGTPSKKWHPHPAILYIIVGKYINVPDHLIGLLKYASETINIEQLLIPKPYSEKYFKTGKKEVALLTGSCASVTISAITVQFAMDMIKKYKNNLNMPFNKYKKEFRDEYDRRIDDYLCGRGVTDPIPWFNPEFFEEKSKKRFISEDKCNKKQKFSHLKICDDLDIDTFCKKSENADGKHPCC